jgi:hypothetical protein
MKREHKKNRRTQNNECGRESFRCLASERGGGDMNIGGGGEEVNSFAICSNAMLVT